MNERSILSSDLNVWYRFHSFIVGYTELQFMRVTQPVDTIVE